MSNSVLITLIICITIIIICILQVIDEFIRNKDNYDHHEIKFGLGRLQRRIESLEEEKQSGDKE